MSAIYYEALELIKNLQAENARLKAEVERLTELNATLSLRYDAINSMLDGCAKEIEELEAQVERLTKAGDEMAMTLHYEGSGSALEDWNKVKGVQS